MFFYIFILGDDGGVVGIKWVGIRKVKCFVIYSKVLFIMLILFLLFLLVCLRRFVIWELFSKWEGDIKFKSG